jgi:hypothetical protein
MNGTAAAKFFSEQNMIDVNPYKDPGPSLAPPPARSTSVWSRIANRMVRVRLRGFLGRLVDCQFRRLQVA